MNTTTLKQKPHSADYFGEARDLWWNIDFLELIARRLQLESVKTILDVGCGIGHWGQTLARVLSEDAKITGIDREDVWICKARERADAHGLTTQFIYQQGDASRLPFNDREFDLVTCQTVLIHLKDPKLGLQEMLRVLKPGGVLLVAEPNNFANRAVMSSLTESLSVEEVIDSLRFELIIERGKKALGLGFNSVGDLLPGYLTELGAKSIDVFISDKPQPLFPPYSPKDQQINIQQMRAWAQAGFIGWDQEELRQYFVAGGGGEDEFSRYTECFLRQDRRTLEAIDAGTYYSAGGGLMYLVSAQKPRD